LQRVAACCNVLCIVATVVDVVPVGACAVAHRRRRPVRSRPHAQQD
jgi:hypothetical protein